MNAFQSTIISSGAQFLFGTLWNRLRGTDSKPPSRRELPVQKRRLNVTALLVLGAWLWMAVGGNSGQASETRPRQQTYVIGLSPYLATSAKDPVFREVLRFLMHEQPLGSSLYLYDAYRVREIADVRMPDVSAFRSVKTRANQFRRQISELKAFLAKEHAPPKDAAPDGAPSGLVRFPQFMTFIGENLVEPDRPVTVILLGSPIYIDFKEVDFSMRKGFFPSDGHLRVNSERSIFGVQDRQGLLPDVSVHFGYVGDPWVNELHHHRIDRFWSLFLKGQGARLDSFSGDLATVFRGFAGDLAPAYSRNERYEVNPGDTKVQMLRIHREVEQEDWIKNDSPAGLTTRPPDTTVGPMKIGIRWRGNLDVDLYARPARDREELFFEHTRIPEGYYFKDHRSSPENEYEYIVFESSVSVWDVEARVNLYEGNAPGGVMGEVRIEFDGGVYQGVFSVEAERGNRGREGGGQRPFWDVLDLPRILRLRP